MNKRSIWRVTAFVVVLLLAPSLAIAAEGHGEADAHGDAHGSPSIWAGDFGNVIWTLVIFLTVVYILGRYAWGPLLNALKNREDFIRESIEEARKEREEAQRLLQEYTEQLNKAREEASAICDEGRRDAEELRRKIESQARTEADNMIKRARREIEVAHQDAIKNIYDMTADLATQVAARILAEEIDADKHRDLVASSLEEIRSKGEASSN